MSISNIELALTLSYPVVGIQTFEQMRAKELISELAESMNRFLYVMTFQEHLDPNSITKKIKKALDDENRNRQDSPYTTAVILDQHFFARSKSSHSILPSLQASIPFLEGEGFTYIISGKERLKEEYAYYVDLPSMSESDYLKAIQLAEDAFSQYTEGEPVFSPEDTKLLVNHARGLPFTQAKNTMIAAAYRKFKNEDYLDCIYEQKSHILREAGLDTMTPIKMDHVGGLEPLKKFITIRKKGWDQGLPVKGILLAGVPGAGKSLISKALAGVFGCSLVALDMSRFYSKYVGQTESLFRQALSTIEQIAPVVVFIDEIEKYFGQSQSDHEVTQRLLGTFLTWLQERKPGIFICATANKVNLLPPELIRAGRWDRSFFVDLPTPKERQKILEIHLKKHPLTSHMGNSSELSILVDSTKDFTGAEIEQAVIDSTFIAASQDRQVTLDDLKTSIFQITPTAHSRSAEIESIRGLLGNGFYPANSTLEDETVLQLANNIKRKLSV